MYVHTCVFIFEQVDKKPNNYAVTLAKKLCASHEENINIMLEWDFGRIPKIDIILKTNKYFLTKCGQYIAKSYMQKAMYFSFSNIDSNLILGIFHTGFRFFWDTLQRFYPDQNFDFTLRQQCQLNYTLLHTLSPKLRLL